jgi:hypothetical protein
MATPNSLNGKQLQKWLTAYRLGHSDLATILTEAGHPITRARVWQWCKGGHRISPEWQERIREVQAGIAWQDVQRARKDVEGALKA